MVLHNQGDMERIAMEKRINGECGQCGNPVVKIIDSKISCRSDGLRFATPAMLADDDNWEMFRCRKCRGVIDQTWRPIGEPIINLESQAQLKCAFA